MQLLYRLVVLALTIVMAGCATGTPKAEEALPLQTGTVQVALKNIRFEPQNIKVKAGTKVIFVNQDAMAHDVVGIGPKEYGKQQPGFDSGVLRPGGSWELTLDKPGTQPIICTQAAHYTAGMVGTIEVVE